MDSGRLRLSLASHFWRVSHGSESSVFPSLLAYRMLMTSYFTRAIGWARKYGLRILLDFHALPGSQNGWNHSGRGIGIVNWMYGVMGLTNARRSLEQIRSMVEFISQEGIKEVVPACVCVCVHLSSRSFSFGPPRDGRTFPVSPRGRERRTRLNPQNQFGQ